MSNMRNGVAAEGPADSTSPAVTPPPPAAAQVNKEFAKLMGEVCWLMSRTPHRRHAFMADLEWLLMPPLALGQARLYRNEKGDPAAFASWATVSDEVDARLRSGVARLAPPEWRSGPHLWIFDIVAPFGGANELLDTLNKTALKDKNVAVLPLGGKWLAEVLSSDK